MSLSCSGARYCKAVRDHCGNGSFTDNYKFSNKFCRIYSLEFLRKMFTDGGLKSLVIRAASAVTITSQKAAFLCLFSVLEVYYALTRNSLSAMIEENRMLLCVPAPTERLFSLWVSYLTADHKETGIPIVVSQHCCSICIFLISMYFSTVP